MLKSPKLLTPYDIEKPLVLPCNASPVRVGAVLAHQTKDGSDRPIGYASRAITTTEQMYAQIDKEALAIVYGIKRCYQYRNHIIHTDHKPLMYLFNENRSIPATASARIQRWALTISGYTYQIRHRTGTKLGNPDGFSRRLQLEPLESLTAMIYVRVGPNKGTCPVDHLHIPPRCTQWLKQECKRSLEKRMFL
uniref:Reverse transcriptase RNase H-like domain-containing protein n=1 Tax=Amphimedon queenslandica TaxID=400682 RepID=A0A1X7VFL7_AMPQE